jgi:hypothetical protein
VLPGFLAGHLHNINGALNIDAGTGRAQLLISGEASTQDNSDILITDRVGATDPTGFVATLNRAPFDGDTWTMRLNATQSVSVTYGETVNSVVVRTLDEFAAALAFKVVALADFAAAVIPATGAVEIRATGGVFDAPAGSVTRGGPVDNGAFTIAAVAGADPSTTATLSDVDRTLAGASADPSATASAVVGLLPVTICPAFRSAAMTSVFAEPVKDSTYLRIAASFCDAVIGKSMIVFFR